MWKLPALLLVLIKSSDESCIVNNGPRLFERSHYHYYKISNSMVYNSNILCTEIGPNDNFTTLLSEYDMSNIRTLIIINSSLPEISRYTFPNITQTNVSIQANVQIVQEKAFEDSYTQILRLDNNDLKKIKRCSFNSENLFELSLENNSLSDIETMDFYGLTKLNKLNLRHNQISIIEDGSFGSLVNLEELDLSSNKLTELPSKLFYNMTNLITITLNDNFLSKLSDNIFSRCKMLTDLRIVNNLITTLDTTHFPISLNYLNASNNLITSIHVSNMHNLNSLDLRYNSLSKITDWFYSTPVLKTLYLSFNNLGPSLNVKSLRHLKELTTFHLVDNGLQKFNMEILNDMPNLKIIELAKNNLTDVDFSKFNSNIDSINLGENSLTELKNISSVKKLVVLDANNNNLQKIDYDMFDDMIHLRVLNLSYNSIHTLHMGCFRDLRSLKELDLAHNHISSVQVGSFAGLSSMNSINLSYNNLTYLDENIFHSSKRINKLNIAYNHLRDTYIRRIILDTHWSTVFDVNGNNLSCRTLGDLTRQVGWRGAAQVVPGTSYNVSNVLGIPCDNNSDDDVNMLANLTMYKNLNFITENAKQISLKMTVNNVLLIALLIFICIRFTSIKCCSWFAASKQFVYSRYKSDQEMQLV